MSLPDPPTEPAPAVAVAAPSRPPVWPAFMTFALVVAASAVVQLGVLGLVAVRHASELRSLVRDSDAVIALLMSRLSQGPGMPVMIALTELVLAAIAVGAARVTRPGGTWRLNLGPSRFQPLDYALTLVGVLAVGMSLEGVAAHAPVESTSLAMLGDASTAPARYFFPLLIAGSLGAGVCEELVFRGYMASVLGERWRPWANVLATSLCFGAIHADPIHAPLAMGLGLFLGFAALRARSIRPTIFAHAANNALSFLGGRYHSDLDAGAPSLLSIVFFLGLALACVAALRSRTREA